MYPAPAERTEHARQAEHTGQAECIRQAVHAGQSDNSAPAVAAQAVVPSTPPQLANFLAICICTVPVPRSGKAPTLVNHCPPQSHLPLLRPSYHGGATALHTCKGMGESQQGDRATPPPVHLLALPGQDKWDSLATSDLLATTPTLTAQESFGCTKQVRQGGMSRRSRKSLTGRLMLVSHNVNSIMG